MDNLKNIVTGGIITLVVGGVAYSVNQTDVINNFANNTGFTQEQAEQYINEIPDKDLGDWGEISVSYINEGQGWLDIINQIDCVNYEYEWETPTMSCIQGKSQMTKIARDHNLVGQAFNQLELDSASLNNVEEAISLIDQLNSDYELEIVRKIIDFTAIDESRKTNLYNKAILEAILQSE